MCTRAENYSRRSRFDPRSKDDLAIMVGDVEVESN